MLSGRKNGVSYEEMQAQIRAAVADAQTAAVLTAHISQCEKDKAEHKRLVEDMHKENQARLTRVERIIYVAFGLVIAVSLVTKVDFSHLITAFGGH